MHSKFITNAMLEDCKSYEQWNDDWTKVWNYLNNCSYNDISHDIIHKICEENMLHLFDTSEILSGDFISKWDTIKECLELDNKSKIMYNLCSQFDWWTIQWTNHWNFIRDHHKNYYNIHEIIFKVCKSNKLSKLSFNDVLTGDIINKWEEFRVKHNVYPP